jgi:hypothetical protein
VPFSSLGFVVDYKAPTSNHIETMVPNEQISHNNCKVPKNIKQVNDLVPNPPHVFVVFAHHCPFYDEYTNTLY